PAGGSRQGGGVRSAGVPCHQPSSTLPSRSVPQSPAAPRMIRPTTSRKVRMRYPISPMALASGTAMNSQTKTVFSMPQSLRTPADGSPPLSLARAPMGVRALGRLYHILVAGNPSLEERPRNPDADDGRNPDQDGVGLDG